MSTDIALSFNLDKALSGTSGGRNFNRLKVPKNGSVVVRILPPYGTNNQGGLSSKYTVHWGFMDAEQNARPVACSYPSERYCPVCDMVKKARSEMEELKRQGSDDGKRYEQLKKTVDTFNPKTFFLFNVVDLADGEVKMLELPKTAVSGKGDEIAPNSLLGKIKEAVEKRKFDPIALSGGVWFEVSRNGDGLNTVYSVDFNRITKMDSDGNEVEALNRSPIEESTVNKIKAQLKGEIGPMYDVHSMYEDRTSTQLKSFIDGAPVPNKAKKQTSSTSQIAVDESETETTVSTTEARATKVSVGSATPSPAPLETQTTTSSGASNVQSEIQRLREKAKLKTQNGA